MLSANRTIPSATKEAVESTSSSFNWRKLFITFGLLLAFCSLGAAFFLPSTERVLKTVEIQNIPIAQALPKVANPTGEFDTSLGVKIVPEDWRWLILKAAKEDGSIADVELLRPLWWLEVQSLVWDASPFSDSGTP